MKDRALFKRENKKDRNGNRPCDGKKAEDYPEVLSELYYRQLLLSNSFFEWKAANAFRWIEGYGNYINNQIQRKSGAFATTMLRQWEIVSVDLFGSFRNEMNFDHPALIIKVLDNSLLVIIPITSSEETYRQATGSTPSKDLIAIPKRINSLGNMSKNSTLLLGHLKVISKHRVLKKEFETENQTGNIVWERKVITHKEQRKLINRKVAELYTSGHLHELHIAENEMKKRVDELKQNLIDKETTLNKLQTDYDGLNDSYLELKAELEARKND